MARNINSWFTSKGDGELLQYTRDPSIVFEPREIYYTAYPISPKFQPTCPVNVEIDTLPENYPRTVRNFGPASIKHIYSDIPNYYPVEQIAVPSNTMYDFDTSMLGPYSKRLTYGFQAYPFHHYSPRETRHYADHFLPIPNIFDYTRYKTQLDGAWGR